MPTQEHTPRTIDLGKVTLGAELGRGGFGIVYRASLSGLNRAFAIKLLHPSPFHSAAGEPAARFFREAEFLMQLRHPYIVQLLGVGMHEAAPYILMEYVDGLDLQRMRERYGIIKPHIVLPGFHKMALALSHAHTKNIVHRDIKPRNLMVSKGDARILDFGVAGRLEPETDRLTRTGSMVGDSFSAPEFIDDPKTMDPRCDVYSLGACWYWTITGRTPRGHNLQTTLRTTAKVAPDYEAVLLRCLDQIDRRHGSASELAEDIAALIGGTQPKTSPDALRDDDAYVLGLVAADCIASGDLTTQYKLEQESTISRFSLGVALRKLLRLGYVANAVGTNEHGEQYPALSLTEEGSGWVEAHRDVVEAEMSRRKRDMPPRRGTIGDDDIPF